MTTAREEAERLFDSLEIDKVYNGSEFRELRRGLFVQGAEWQSKQPIEITDEMVGKAQLALIRNANIPTSEGPWLIGTRLYLGENKEVDMYDVVYAVLEAALGGSGE